jgi:polysaccharide biosynthesis transport protein
MAASEPTRPQLPAIWRRRHRPMLATLVLVLLGATITAVLWPPTYVSTGTILIEQQELPMDLVRSTISTFADQRIQMINQRVMTSDNLLGIVSKYDLYPEERKQRGREKILDMIRSDIRFGSIKASVIDPRQGRPVEATIAFSLSYQSPSPEQAARVANELSSLYLQENLESRRQQVDEATSFFRDEAEKLSKRMVELDVQLAAFKREHINTLPDSAGMNLQFVARADDEKRDVDTQLRSLDQNITFLTAQLAQIGKSSPIYASTGERIMSPADRIKGLRTDLARASAIYAPDHPDVVRLKRELDGLAVQVADSGADNERQRQLQDAQTRLASTRQRYAPDHPDVKNLERLVATLAAPATSLPPAGAPAAGSVDEPDNPAYVQLRAQLDASRNERTSLERKRADLVERVTMLEARLSSTPGVERDYMVLARELDNTQSKYKEYRQKEMEAQQAQSLETQRKGERFSLIDPPVAPDEPASPNRKLIIALGLVLALGLSAGIAALLEMTDQRIHGRNDVASLLSVPPLAVIPWIENASQVAMRRRRQRLALVGSVASVAIMICSVHFLYRPLDVLWSIAMRRLGN